MANSYFQFKQFTIHQDECAMKVTTDGCLFGAVTAKLMDGGLLLTDADRKLPTANQLPPTDIRQSPTILDIGAGTGLLSLMFAQKHPTAIIDAVEIDERAAVQCQQNFDASPWRERLKTHCSPIQDFATASVAKYDAIISNPPFYEQQLKGTDAQKNLAHHSSGLSLEELFACTALLLKSNGLFMVMLPFYRIGEAIKIAEQQHLFLQQKILLKQTPQHGYFRGILVFSSFKKETVLEETIVVKTEENIYSKRFSELLEDYYLAG